MPNSKEKIKWWTDGISESPKKRKRFKKKYMALILSALLIYWNISNQKSVNAEHASMEFSFDPNDIPTEEALKYLIITPEYSSKIKKFLSRKWIDVDWNIDSYSIFVNLKDHESIWDKKSAINELRERSSRPILISSDFEGWYIHAIDKLTPEEIEKYWVPQELIDLRNDEDWGKGNVSFFPSAEYLGKKYENIVFEWTYQERYDFLVMMQKYWECVSRIMEDIWVNIVFWPCVDIVPDFDDEKYPIAKHDRSFWDNFITSQDLISAFVNWFQSLDNNVLLVPKHYVWLWESTTDPHLELSSADIDRDSWAESIFRNLINWENPQLNWTKNETFINCCKNKKVNKQSKYFKILQKNKWFIEFLEEHWKSLSWWERIRALMTTHSKWLRGLDDETITYSKKIIDKLKKNVWKASETSNNMLFTDDLSMKWAEDWLPEWFEDSEVNKILLALSSWHDVVMDLWSGCNWWEILEEAARIIDTQWVDVDNDGVIDLDRNIVLQKLEKCLNLLVKNWDLLKTSKWSYRLSNATYFDPSLWKAIRDAIYSNQWPISWSWRDEYNNEWNSTSDMISKKIKSLYEFFVHNWPNAIWKSRNQIFDAIMWNDDYKKELEDGKKMVIVDKSECKMLIYTIDGKKLLETHDVWVWKWTDKLDYKHDRRILWDDKTPVWYYVIVDRVMWWDELRENVKNIDRYWWENGWMIVLVWPWTPYVAIHGTNWDIWPSSNACVRVLDESERGNADKSAQKAINHLSKMLPDWSYVIITN